MKSKNNPIFFILTIIALLLASRPSNAQKLSQTVRGSVIDEDGKFPLIGASITLSYDNLTKGTITNNNGEFRFENVPVGRVVLIIRYIGYEDNTVQGVIISSGKESILKVEMKESLHTFQDVVITGQKQKGEVKNEMALISSRAITVEESKRFSGSFQDPSRMVSSYAGVTGDPSGNNDIVVRGNSPKGILWRLEGVDIPNPNHFAQEGSTGGAISALNSELLANSDFYTGAFEPEYGDVLSGVFDMKLRTGNNEKREYSVGVGVLGTDIAVEGPFKKDYEGSYLANYRYSSLSMLDKAGLVNFDGVPKYQDGAFKINLPSTKRGMLSIFGLGGKSSLYQEPTESNESNRIVAKNNVKAQLAVIGLNHTLPISQNTFVRFTLAVSNNANKYIQDEIDSLNSFTIHEDDSWAKNSIRSAFLLNSKLNSRNRLMIGAKYDHQFYNMYGNYFDHDLNRQVTSIDMKSDAGTFQSYVSWKYRLNDNITMVSGLHGTYFSLYKHFLVEPRLAIHWQLSEKQAFNIGYGMHSKTESIITYFTHVNLPDGSDLTPNTGLGLAKAQHYVMGYEYRITENLNSKVDLYYQNLYNIPVENIDTSSFSMLNSDEGYVDKALINSGKGRNYGLEYTLEKYFNKDYYFLLTASLYDSKYKAKDGITRNTKYNGNYAVNFLIGKEFKVGKSKVNTLGVNTKIFYTGGRRYIPVLLEASRAKGETVYDYTQAWKKKLDDILQVNFSLSYRINRPKTSHEISLDILNVADSQGRTSEYYNKYTHQIDHDHQLSLLPNIMYRIHF
jgi:hypothetical protein